MFYPTDILGESDDDDDEDDGDDDDSDDDDEDEDGDAQAGTNGVYCLLVLYCINKSFYNHHNFERLPTHCIQTNPLPTYGQLPRPSPCHRYLHTG